MKKQYIVLACAIALLSLPALSFSASLSNKTDGAGAAVSLSSTDLTGSVQPFEFQPSPNVITLGNSDASNFAVAAYNESSVGADGGEGYGMAADTSGTWVDNSISDGTAPALSGTLTTSGAFATDWAIMD